MIRKYCITLMLMTLKMRYFACKQTWAESVIISLITISSSTPISQKLFYSVQRTGLLPFKFVSIVFPWPT
nr:unnamed protein product [Callosobruchus chinensis]